MRNCVCGGNPKVVTEYYPHTKYKMYRIRCDKCMRRTYAYRRLHRAEQEWNNPINIRMNSEDVVITR